MRITKDQLRERVGRIHSEVDRLFKMNSEVLFKRLQEEVPGAHLAATRDDALRYIIKQLIMTNFHPGHC